MKNTINIEQIIEIAIEAGEKILVVYNSPDYNIEYKSDESPLTLADKKSHEIIKRRLTESFPEIPLLSEEGKAIPFNDRKNWNRFWLIDPLDGTKEFIKQNGEFTVNIALIDNGVPVLGVIFAPILNTIYYASQEIGAFKQVLGEEPQKLPLPRSSDSGEDVIAVKSRSHSSDEENKILSNYGVTKSISIGSSLKFCLVAEGKADIYYRHGPTMEWDVGAGHAIVLAAGGSVENLEYNKENLLNSSFLIKKF